MSTETTKPKRWSGRSGVLVLFWVAGFILAKGFWLSTLALFVPFYAYYLVVYKLMVMGGVIT